MVFRADPAGGQAGCYLASSDVPVTTRISDTNGAGAWVARLFSSEFNVAATRAVMDSHNCFRGARDPAATIRSMALMSAFARAFVRSVVLMSLLFLSGCVGIGDMFEEKRHLTGDYYIERPDGGIYLFVEGKSSSVTGHIQQIGWNQQYIIFTDINSPQPWSLIVVKEHRTLTITEAERIANEGLKKIRIINPSEAWNRAK